MLTDTYNQVNMNPLASFHPDLQKLIESSFQKVSTQLDDFSKRIVHLENMFEGDTSQLHATNPNHTPTITPIIFIQPLFGFP